MITSAGRVGLWKGVGGSAQAVKARKSGGPACPEQNQTGVQLDASPFRRLLSAIYLAQSGLADHRLCGGSQLGLEFSPG
jgi:hypothetical protein